MPGFEYKKTLDGTEDVVREREAANRGVRLIVEPLRVGKGGAISQGFRAARGNRVGFVDADGATPPEATQWAFDIDLLFQVRRAGHAIVELPTTWTDRDGSKVQSWKTPVEMFPAVTRLRLSYSPLAGFVRLYDRVLGQRLYTRRIQPR